MLSESLHYSGCFVDTANYALRDSKQTASDFRIRKQLESLFSDTVAEVHPMRDYFFASASIPVHDWLRSWQLDGVL